MPQILPSSTSESNVTTVKVTFNLPLTSEELDQASFQVKDTFYNRTSSEWESERDFDKRYAEEVKIHFNEDTVEFSFTCDTF